MASSTSQIHSAQSANKIPRSMSHEDFVRKKQRVEFSKTVSVHVIPLIKKESPPLPVSPPSPPEIKNINRNSVSIIDKDYSGAISFLAVVMLIVFVAISIFCFYKREVTLLNLYTGIGIELILAVSIICLKNLESKK